MKQRIVRLQQIFMIREQDTLVAAQAFKEARDEFLAGKEKHEQLLSYRQDYVQQIEALGETGCEVSRMRNRLNFISQLDEALSQMGQHLSQLAKQRSECEKKYLKARAAQEAVKKLLRRVEKQQNAKLDRVEQKESDEYAQKEWYSKR